LLDAMGLEPGQRGAVVTSVANGGPADEVGLRGADSTAEIDGVEYSVGGDVIIAVDGDPIFDFDDLVAYLVENTRPGDEVVMTILRDGEQQDITVTLGDRVEYQTSLTE
jgi:S1-C subfamily serine protease